MTGNKKFKPVIVGQSENPRVFKNFNINEICYYYSNKNSWMTSVIFSDLLNKWNSELKEKSLIILDNFAGHKNINNSILNNIENYYSFLQIQQVFCNRWIKELLIV